MAVTSTQAIGEKPAGSSPYTVGTVRERGGTWYAILRRSSGEEKLYTKGDIFCSDSEINHCLRIQDIKRGELVLKDVRSNEIFTITPGERIPLEGTAIVFEKVVKAGVIEYRYNDAPGIGRGEAEDFTVKALEQGRIVVEKDYDKTYLPQGLAKEEKEIFRQSRIKRKASERIEDSVFGQIEVTKVGRNTWTIDTGKVRTLSNDLGKALFSILKGVKPRYRFGKGPGLRFKSELGDIVVNKKGFLIQDLAAGKIVKQVGIQRGDLIKSINGRQVNSLYDIYRAYMGVRSDRDKVVNVEIVRDGMPRRLNYNIRE